MKGVGLKVIKYAPLQDPIEVLLKDYHLTLRVEEAAHIDVTSTVINQKKPPKFALAGNPNSGKTSLFNMITGAHQKVGNWGGVTVDMKIGTTKLGNKKVEMVDLPGTYSLTAFSMEETVARDFIIEEEPEVVINVLDSSNLERNLYLTVQLIELKTNMLLAFNMSDEAKKKGVEIDTKQLSKLLGCDIINTVGRAGKGVKTLLTKAKEMSENKELASRPVPIPYPKEIENEIQVLVSMLERLNLSVKYKNNWLALKLLENDKSILNLIQNAPSGNTILEQLEKSQGTIQTLLGDTAETIIAEARYGFIAGALKETVRYTKTDRIAVSDKVDKVLTNKFIAFPLFLFAMWLLFQATFTIGAYPMDWIDAGVGWLGEIIGGAMPAGNLRDLVVDGVIGGVGGVIIFLPNILILFLGVSIMEDTGYMARAAFIMDKLMHYMGLHGKSFIPMVMGFGCNVPAIMAARTLESKSDRIMTILLAPLISCSARLPVYILFAGAFFPNHAGNIIFSLYILGIAIAFFLGMLFRKTLFRGENYPFVMELPPYRLPTLRSVFIHMWDKGKHYLKKMGGVVLVFSVLLWFMGAFPKNQEITETYNNRMESVETAGWLSEKEKSTQLSLLSNEKNSFLMKQSYIGRVGSAIEPVLTPLGFDWRAGVALITGFVAKEVVVSSMGVLFNVGGEEDEESQGLREKLKSAFTPLSAYAFMVFVLLYTPCIVALVTVIRELKSWKYSVFSVTYQLVLAWTAAFIVYQGGRLFGLS
ncbi:MAG: ferrous iron transport protein B [Fibrobacteria bacterium]|nr:ferrous iron transport protein B [Fibrobacteria bacterium]